MTSSNTARRTPAALLLAAALTACSPGHGTYTEAFRQQAQANMDRVKAGTAWDMARQRFLAGDLEKALDGVDESLELAPDIPKSHRLRGRILMEMGRLEHAMKSLGRAIELDPADPAPPYYAGLILERWSKHDAALESFRAAATNDPTDPQHTIASAEMLIQLDRLDEAEHLLNTAAQHFEHNAGVRQTLGHLAMMRGQPALAAQHFEAACLLAPDEEGLTEDLARAQIAAGRFAEAEFNLARLLRDQNDDQTRRDLLHLRARCLLELDRPVEARRLYERLTAHDAGAADVAAWIGLGRTARTLRHDALASRAAARLTEIAPDRPEGWILRASALRDQRMHDAAIATLQRAATTLPPQRTATVHALKAAIEQDIGRTADAIASARTALNADPTLTAAAQLLDRLNAAQNNAAVVNVEVNPDD